MGPVIDFRKPPDCKMLDKGILQRQMIKFRGQKVQEMKFYNLYRHSIKVNISIIHSKKMNQF